MNARKNELRSSRLKEKLKPTAPLSEPIANSSTCSCQKQNVLKNKALNSKLTAPGHSGATHPKRVCSIFPQKSVAIRHFVSTLETTALQQHGRCFCLRVLPRRNGSMLSEFGFSLTSALIAPRPRKTSVWAVSCAAPREGTNKRCRRRSCDIARQNKTQQPLRKCARMRHLRYISHLLRFVFDKFMPQRFSKGRTENPLLFWRRKGAVVRRGSSGGSSPNLRPSGGS